MVTPTAGAADQPDVPLATCGDNSRATPPYSLGQLALYALRLGTLGFGGPVALVGYMHRDLVERRRWISEADYREGLTLAQLMPGPLAAPSSRGRTRRSRGAAEES